MSEINITTNNVYSLWRVKSYTVANKVSVSKFITNQACMASTITKSGRRHNQAINATSGLSHFVWKIEFKEAHLRVIANTLCRL